MPYLTRETFRLISSAPSTVIDDVDAVNPGFVERHLERVSSYVDSRLRKRYAVPFASPVPLVIERWIATLVTREVLLKRGLDPLDQQWPEYTAAAERSEKELLEAANSDTGLFDLPLRDDAPAGTGVARGGPYVYSEASPFVAFDEQRRAGIGEDCFGRGTGG